MKTAIAALVAGLIFSLGLAISGMTLPSKIVGFLDVFGDWDPSLAFVMMGAVGVHFGTRLLVMKRERSLFQPRFVLPTRNDIDGRLLTGAALFGAGWGIAGFCPGPALTSLGKNSGAAWIFVMAMAAGMLLFAAYDHWTQQKLVPNEIPKQADPQAPGNRPVELSSASR